MPMSEDSLDLTEGEIGFDYDTETVIWRLGVKDMTELPPAGAVGRTFYVNFGYDGERYFVTALDHAVQGQFFGLGTFDSETNLRTGLGAATVTGEFDYDSDTVVIELSADESFAIPYTIPEPPEEPEEPEGEG